MNRYFHIALSIWLFAAIPMGLAEDFPDRPTGAEMDEVVRLGTECAKGMNERCWATQYEANPARYRVEPFTNTAQWYLDQNLMGTMASRIRTLMPWYANPATVYDGMTNITMLTVPGVWASLGIGDRINQFTDTPASGANPATYGDSPWRIYKKSLQERYNVLQAQKKTTAPVTQTWSQVWQGMGRGHTYQEARSAAVADYGPKASGYFSTWVRQSTKGIYWSNFVAQGGSGATNELPDDGPLEYEVETNYFWRTDLHITLSNVIIVASSDIGNLVTTNILTNMIVTGDTSPDVTGTYIELMSPYGPYREWYKSAETAAFLRWYLNQSPPSAEISALGFTFGVWWRHDGAGTMPEGLYYPVYPASGNAYAAFSNAFEVITNPVSPVDYSGIYEPKPGYWEANGYYIYLHSNLNDYVIYSSLELDTNEAYLINETLLGSYEAVNFVADTEVYYDNVAIGPNPSGTFVGDCNGTLGWSLAEQSSWSNNDWRIFWGTSGNWFVTSDMGSNEPPEPSWSMPAAEGDPPVGTYATIHGTGIFGTVSVTWTMPSCDDRVETNAVFYTHTWDWDGGSTTIFYQCWLTKVKSKIAANPITGGLTPDCTGTYIEQFPGLNERWWRRPLYPYAALWWFPSVAPYIMVDNFPRGNSYWDYNGSTPPEGVYAPRAGTGATGTAYAVYSIAGGLTNIIVTPTYLNVLNTDTEHQADLWVYSQKPNYGTLTNIYTNQNLGLYENAWKKEATTAWTFDETFSIDFGDPVSVVPVDIPDPSLLSHGNNINQSITIGFTDDFKAIMNWRFQYCK